MKTLAAQGYRHRTTETVQVNRSSVIVVRLNVKKETTSSAQVVDNKGNRTCCFSSLPGQEAPSVD